MTHIEFDCSDEKAAALLRASRLYDEGVKPSEWISVKVDLPKDRQRVLIYDGNASQWNPSTHSAVFVKGRTKEEIMDEYRRTGRLYYTFGDEEGNNKKPYRWRGDGHMEWFGQTVTHWRPLPEDPKGD